MKRIFLPITAIALLSACSLSFSMGIFEAIRTKDIRRIRELIEIEQVDVNNIVNNNGETPLNCACSQQESQENSEITQLILNKCTIGTINKANNCGWTALFSACFGNNLPAVQLIISKCTDYTINKTDEYGYTSLYRSLQKGHQDLIRLILANGANVDIKSIEITQDNSWAKYPNIEATSKLFTLAQDLDNGYNKIKIIDNQTDDSIVDMLSKRLYKKYGIKYKKTLDILRHKKGLQKYSDCTIKIVE